MNAPVKSPSTALHRMRLHPLPVLLLDISGSMTEGQPRRIDILWQAVQALRTPASRWKVAVFSSECRWVDIQAVPEPDGGTDLARAFRDIGQVSPTSVTLVTDGEPMDETAAHEAGLALGCPINILFVGDAHDQDARRFCQELCTATHGTFATETLTLTSASAVTDTIRRMLGDGSAAKPAIAMADMQAINAAMAQLTEMLQGLPVHVGPHRGTSWRAYA